LSKHPDKRFVEFILRGITSGFKVGYNVSEKKELKSSSYNMLSAMEHPQVVSDYISEEVRAGRVLLVGHKDDPLVKEIHLSPFGVIPKKSKPNKWRLIVDLSSPEGHSVNDGILKELASLSYISVDDVAAVISRLGRGSLVGKLDIKQAYRNVPVHPADRFYLGMEWEGCVYIVAALPFGLRSAPLLFTALADAVQWVVQQEGVRWILHYIDDFITVGAPGSAECSYNMSTMERVCHNLGLPVEEKKTEGPATCITFLGIELDTVAMEMRLPAAKLNQLKQTLRRWRGYTSIRKGPLESLIGFLSHACKVVRSGRTFLRRLISASAQVDRKEHFVRLTECVQADLEWWYTFGTAWNGISMMLTVNKTHPSCSLTTDASGSWGCGAFSDNKWFSMKWSLRAPQAHITVQELIPIVIAAALWGRRWSGQTVQVWCDNEAAVSIINTGTSMDLEALHLMRCLAFISAKFQFYLFATHVQGKRNVIADALSRNKMHLFRSLYPQAHMLPTEIPEALLDLLIIRKPDWRSPIWTTLWNSIFSME